MREIFRLEKGFGKTVAIAFKGCVVSSREFKCFTGAAVEGGFIESYIGNGAKCFFEFVCEAL